MSHAPAPRAPRAVRRRPEAPASPLPAPGERPGDEAALRAEHDALAERLSARRSIDVMRRFAYTAFAAVLTTGITVKLGFDRWVSTRPTRFQGPPLFFIVALCAAAALVAAAAVLYTRSRKLMAAEDALFARMRALRDRLGLDP
jgi:hypothetical protein